MALHELTKMKKIAEESFNDKEMKPLDLVPFAMEIDENEEPMRMYKASVTNVDGMLLITDKQLIFVGHSRGQALGTKCAIENTKAVGHKRKGKDAQLLINMDGEVSTFTVSRFDVKRLTEQIG